MSNKPSKNSSKNRNKTLQKSRPKSAKATNSKHDGCEDSSLFDKCDFLEKQDKNSFLNRLEETASAPTMLTTKERHLSKTRRSKHTQMKEESPKSLSALDTLNSTRHDLVLEVQSFEDVSQADVSKDSRRRQSGRDTNTKTNIFAVQSAKSSSGIHNKKSKHFAGSTVKTDSKPLSRIKSSKSSSEMHNLKHSCGMSSSASSRLSFCKSSRVVRTSRSLSRMRAPKHETSEENDIHEYIPEKITSFGMPYAKSASGFAHEQGSGFHDSKDECTVTCTSASTHAKKTPSGRRLASKSRSNGSNPKKTSSSNTATRKKSSKEFDVKTKTDCSDKAKDKNENLVKTQLQKNNKNEQRATKTCAPRRKSLNTYLSEQRVIRKMAGELDDCTASSLRRYALYRSMINSSRLSDFLSNNKNDVPSTSSDVKESKFYVTPWKPEYDEAQERMHNRYLQPIPDDVSEPDVDPENWDLMGTTLPKRVYIRETINDCVIDEVVDIKDERDWDILTYMSPLRHVDVRHKHHQRLRNLSFADLKDFEVYTYAYPWRVTS